MRKQCRRKVYQRINPIQFAIEGAAITSDQELNRLRIRELSAIEAMATGQSSEQEWHEINALRLIAKNLGLAGVGPEVLPVCVEVKRHLDEAMDRFKRIGLMGTTGPGLTAIRDLFAWHDLQRQSVSRSQYERAIAFTINTDKNGKPKDLEEA